MTKRRSSAQIKSDKIIKQELLKLRDRIIEESEVTSRVAEDTFYKDGSLNRLGGTLRDSQNGNVIKDTTLRMFQAHYGKYNFPKGQSSGEYNALLIAVKREIPIATKIIVADIMAKIIQPFKNKK